MSKTLRVRLTPELLAFVDENYGAGTRFATANEFVCAMLREKKERLEAARLRDAILEGYHDAIHGRTVSYRGDLRRMIDEFSAHRK